MHRNAILDKKIDAEYFYIIGVILHAGLFLLASCRTLGRCGTAEPRLKVTGVMNIEDSVTNDI